MKLLTTIIICLFICFGSTAQSQYEKGMRTAFELWENDKPWEASNLFVRIAQAEPDNWLPPFYVAQIHVYSSFSEKDKEKVPSMLKTALDYLNDAKALAKDNPTVIMLEAQLLTAWVVYDGQQYGMKYSAKINQLYNEALSLAPNNPNVLLAKTEWDIGTAKYFGQSTKSHCEDIERAIELFATFKPEGEFYPRTSLAYAQRVLKENCTKE